MSHDCTHSGHVWMMGEKPYARERGTDLNATVDVTCAHCPATRVLPKYSQFSGARAAGQPIDHTIPPGVKAALDRALAENSRPVPK